ncbi:hypothetical protein B4100_2046 [Heyndrickxia coagulans]|nr:hypothetical protein B4100_2046 [Heyndrickxia coagulans]
MPASDLPIFFNLLYGFVRLCIITAVPSAFWAKRSRYAPHLAACKQSYNLFQSALRLRAALHHYAVPFAFWAKRSRYTPI